MASLIGSLAAVVIGSTGCFFLWLSCLALFRPATASRFLLGFATSAAKHYAELVVRLVVGASFIIRAPYLPVSAVFSLFGWVLIITTVGLLLLPWQWHQRFAQQAVPRALRFIQPLGVISLVLGLALLAVLARGSAD